LRRKDAQVQSLNLDQHLQLFSVPIFQKSEPTGLTTIPQVQICAITPAAVTTDRKAFLHNKFLESEGLTTIATEQSNRTASENHSSMHRFEEPKEIKGEALPEVENAICKLEEIQPLFSKANTKFLFAEYGKPSAIGIYEIDDRDLDEYKATAEFK
jgi:hypothetical protein